MNMILGYTIFILGVLNALQMGVSFIAGDIYDIRHLKSIQKNRKRKYEPFVTIAISAFNEEKVIYRSLQSIYASTYTNFEVIVVNDGSRDTTSAEIVKFMQDYDPVNFRLVRQKNAGKATALNHALKDYAKGTLIMCLDADSILTPHALENAVAHFKDKQVIAAAASVRIIRDGTMLGMFQSIEYLFSYRMKKVRTMINSEYIIGGVGSTFRKSVLAECGYYDTDSVTEDIALTLKLIARFGNKRNKVVYAADVICYTEAIGSLKALFKQRYRWKYGFLQALFKNRELILLSEKNYTRSLTYFMLPLAVYGELLSLLDPLLLAFVLFYSIRYTTLSMFLGMFLFLAGYTFLTVVTDEYTPVRDKAGMLLFVPLSYIFFLVLGIIGDMALIKSLLNFRGIIHSKNAKGHRWETAVRKGISLQNAY